MEGIVTYGHKYDKPTQETVEQKIQEKRQLALDRIVQACHLHFEKHKEEGKTDYLTYDLLHPNTLAQPLEYTQSAFSQMLNRHSVPVAFYNRCTANLQGQIFNEHVRTGPDLLMRMMRDELGQLPDEASMVRAVLSDKYGIVDDHEVFPCRTGCP